MANSRIVFVVSDSTGATGERVLQAALAQFAGAEVDIRTWPHIRTHAEVSDVVYRASVAHALILHTLVHHELRAYLASVAAARGVPVMDVLGPAIDELARFFGSQPAERPGGRVAVLDEAYFRRINAMEFSVRADDGRSPWLLAEADIVLVGVSRTSKTPISTYLAQKGYRVANVPLTKDLPLPKELLEVAAGRVFALTIEPTTLHGIRRRRMEQLGAPQQGEYSDLTHILDDLRAALALFRAHPEWCVIDVTGRAVEETASEILKRRMLTDEVDVEE
jgi:regulator of PEP synthase PpsR (kinase-PPPase family)